MIIREYQPCDCKETADLFYHTVHTVNAKDYTEEQLDAWATGNIDLEKWNQSFLEHYSVVALDGERITGFGDIDRTGCLDRLYVHAEYQGKGIAAAICDKLEQAVRKKTGICASASGASDTISHKKIVTHASLTAKPFFEKRGYRLVREQQAERQGILLTNFVMEYP